jgi:two-component system, OmpR family, response regulator CpxR
MSIISIFSGTFCNEETLIEELTRHSGYTLLRDKEIVHTASSLSKMPVSKIEKAFSAKTSVFNKFTHERERSIAYLKASLADMLLKDNLVVEGFCAHLIPKEMTHILRVCLIADIKFRNTLCEKQKNISQPEAAKLIHAMDEDRAAWVNAIHQTKDPWNAGLYDIVAPVDKMTQENIITLIADNAKKDIFKINKRAQKALEDFQLATTIETALINEGHQIGVKSDNGDITLTINKHVLLLTRLEDELKSIAGSIPGVKSVQTKVGPGFHQADIYRRSNFELPTKILLVDDEREFVQTLSERLLIRDMGSAVAYDGESALELIKEDEPEVMILDLRMPGIDGIEVLKRVKQTNPYIEVIILTGHGSDLDKETCMNLGACAYLQKPVDIDELSEKIKQANERIRLRHGRQPEPL